MMAARALLAIVRTELRLLLRRASFWVYAALGSALAVAVVLTSAATMPWQRALIGVVNNVAFFQLPAIALLAASGAVRHKSQAGEWLWATRLESSVLVAGQALGLAIGLTGALLAPLTAAWASLAVRGVAAPLSLPTFWAHGLLLLGPVTLIELSIAFSLGLWLRHVVLVVLLAAGLDALLWLGVLLPSASLFTPMNHTLLTLRMDPIAGLGAEAPALLPLLGLYSTVALLLVAVSAWGLALADRRAGWRPGHGRWYAGAALAGLAALALARAGYQGAVRRGTVPPPVTGDVGAWAVLSASHSAALAGPSLSVESQLSLRNESPEAQATVLLALNPGLQVSGAAAAGRPVQVHRLGEAIRLFSSGSPVAPGETVDIELSYSGSLILLREDYSLVSALRGQDPTAYRRPVRGYLDASVALLERDGDWRAWPIAAGAHVAATANELTISVRGERSALCSGSIVRQQPGEVVYRWSGDVPQMLLAVAAYETEQRGDGVVALPPLGSPGDGQRARDALALRQALAGWLEQAPAAGPYQAAILPYAREVALGGTLIGLPACNEDWSDELATPRGLAGAMARAWLEEHIAWPKSLGTDGQLRRFVIEFGPADETGQRQSTVRSLGGVNPQAPAGRLVETEGDSVALRALTVVLGQQLAVRWTGDAAAVAEERDEWSTLAAAALASQNAAELYTLARRGFLSPWEGPESARRLAALVVGLERLRSDQGDDGFARFIQGLGEQHPAGGPPLQDGELQQVLEMEASG